MTAVDLNLAQPRNNNRNVAGSAKGQYMMLLQGGAAASWEGGGNKNAAVDKN